MVKEMVQSLKAENEKLKKRVEDVFGELKQLQDLFKTRGDDSHVESSSEAAEQMKSLEYLSKEYDDLVRFRKQVGDKLNAIEKTLSDLLTKVNELSSAIDLAQEYSYSYNVKLVGVPELKQRESAYETSQLCLKIFSAIGVDIKTFDIDIAHRVTPRHAAGAEGRPKPIVCKFTRRLARDQVMALRREVTKIIPSSIGLREQDSMESVGIFDHLSPRLQYLMSDARKFKERFGYAYCWAKNSTIWLRENEGSRPIAIKTARDLENLKSHQGLPELSNH
ncbi:uncharacterized protein [Montipora capricornis]|uniref:uncharacterized protein n=1 Tax=Montipora capricornis TaxID=246305 RepID=UPI0035F169AF